MRPGPARRFTIADAMIVVAAAAVGTVLVRAELPGFSRQIEAMRADSLDFWPLWLAYAWLRGPGSCLIVPLMAAFAAGLGLGDAMPYERLQQAEGWVALVATLGVGALLARDRRIWGRLGRSRPGTLAVLVALIVGGVTVAHQLTAGRPIFAQAKELSIDLRHALEYRLPGAILGAWVVAWFGSRRRRGRPDWRERAALAVGWLWMAGVGLTIGYALLFG